MAALRRPTGPPFKEHWMKTRAKATAKRAPKSARKSASKVRAKSPQAAPHGPSSPARILDLISGMWAARAVGAFARLGIADQLAAGPRTAAELAPAVGADETALYRLMRAVVSIGVLTRKSGGRFGLTAFGQCLRSGVPGTMRAAIASEVDTVHWACWGQLDDCLRTGKPAFEKVFGLANPWDYYRDKNPDEGRLFSENMTAQSGAEVQAVLRAYSFKGARLVVDVGGSHGAFLGAVLKRVPQARGILFDQPDVVGHAHQALSELGVAARSERVGGNFFESVPAGGDLYLLKHILHDWSDEECVRILRCVREAMTPDARVAVVEMPLLEGGGAPFASLLDINMLVCLTGKERTSVEYAELFRRAGLKMTGVTATQSPIAVIEARRA
jgi:O-methyltransferase domain/Dimerisation domain